MPTIGDRRYTDASLLHRHKRADWKFREKSASSVLGQPNAAM